MSSTPRTPASKFFLPKRSSQSSQAHRFLPTPRFASSGARATQVSSSIEDVDENEPDDISDPEPLSAVDEDEILGAELEVTREELPRRTRGRMSLEDSIEIESIVPSDSPDLGSPQDQMPPSTWRYNVIEEVLDEPMPSSPLGVSHERPVAKRRKISISPVATPSPPANDQRGEDVFQQQQSQQDIDDGSLQYDSPGDHDIDGSLDLPDPETKNHGLQPPTFRAPPRFKPLEDEVPVAELPDIFSPRRRGEKYVPGGLAAGLQGWLSEVREGEGKDGNVESTIRITVDEVRPGSAMKLVRGTRLGGESQERQSFILAGEGRVVELGRKPSAITQGSVAIVWQPFWDVKLDDINWTVACDWTIE